MFFFFFLEEQKLKQSKFEFDHVAPGRKSVVREIHLSVPILCYGLFSAHMVTAACDDWSSRDYVGIDSTAVAGPVVIYG